MMARMPIIVYRIHLLQYPVYGQWVGRGEKKGE
jgi:hypothetical protein